MYAYWVMGHNSLSNITSNVQMFDRILVQGAEKLEGLGKWHGLCCVNLEIG